VRRHLKLVIRDGDDVLFARHSYGVKAREGPSVLGREARQARSRIALGHDLAHVGPSLRAAS